MRKVRVLISFIVLATLLMFSYSNVYAINSKTLFEASTFDTLVLNYNTLPSVSVSGSQPYSISDGTCGTGQPLRRVSYPNTGEGQQIDSTVTVKYDNCGTLNGQPIDMKLVYNDIVTHGGDTSLYWTAFGSQMLSTNEFFYIQVEHLNINIYFYYHGSNTPIYLDTAYLSIFSEDKGEGSGSPEINNAYLYDTTRMTFSSDVTSTNGWRHYKNVYYGTENGSMEAGSLNCVAFQYKNKDHINIELYGINGTTGAGYHLQYTPLTATIPATPEKSVNKTESQLGDTITYTVRQRMSQRYDAAFTYSALYFQDVIDPNLTYNSFKLFNENGVDITNSAGSLNYNSGNRTLTYTFSNAYLQNIPYNGQYYTYEINTTVNNSSNSATVSNAAKTVINNSTVLDSNSVSTTLKAKVIVHYKNLQGVTLADDSVINGNLLDAYNTTPYIKDIYAYELHHDSGNTVSNMNTNTTEVTYYYDIRRVDIDVTKTLGQTDSTAVQNLEGARFKATAKAFEGQVGLAQPATEYLSTYTDANGHCIIQAVPFGTYNIVEETIPSKAFAGFFTLNGAADRINNFDIKVNEQKTYSFSAENVPEKMQITIFKEDIETGTTTQGDAHLEGAVYGFFRDEACTDEIERVTIQKNDDGTYSATSKWYLVGTYYVKELTPPEGYLIDENVYTVSQDPVAQTAEFSSHQITSKDTVIRNDIDITKYLEATDSTEKQKLSGAVFTATLDSNTNFTYNSDPTDADGHTVIRSLPYGHYTINETKVPDLAYDAQFYVQGATERSKTFTQFIETDKKYTPVYTFDDINDVAKKMQITIFKEDIETGTTTQGDAHLEGAIYGFYRDRACTDEIERVTIQKNDDGTYSATSKWYLVGTYYVKEITPPEGYLIDENVYTITQDPAAQTTEHTYPKITSKDTVIRNDIDITKYLEATDSTPKQKLSGAVFTATLDSNTNFTYDSDPTDENGNTTIYALPYGHYTINESKVPDLAYDAQFYVQGATERSKTFTQFIELDKKYSPVYAFDDINDVAKKMQITVFKEDDETATKTQGDSTLAGAEYTLYRDEACTDAVETITIAKNEDGTWSATSGWYLVAKYWIKETKAPEGYNIDEQVYSVEVIPGEQTEEHSSHSILSKDKAIEGLVQIIKYNNDTTTTEKTPAVGAKLRLTLDSNPEVYYDVIINENGQGEFVDTIDDIHYSSTEHHCKETCYPYTIPYGVYTISEVQASNSGKHIFIDRQKTQIKYEGQVQKYILDDEVVRMNLTIQKVDSETNKIIPAAEATFKIWDINNQRWYEEMIYPSGKFVSEFTTNEKGQLTINRFLESGGYVLYEVQAPNGYYLEDDLRTSGKGYEFAIGVGKDGNVVLVHDSKDTVLQYHMENVDNIPQKMYEYTAVIPDTPQKAVIKITDLAKQFTKVDTSKTDFGTLNTPVFEEVGLAKVEFDIIAKEDIYTREGTKRYSKGQIVSHVITDGNGYAETVELYLGKYDVVQTSVPQGYVVDKTPIELNIEYTNQYEKVQYIPLEVKQKAQDTKLKFVKEFEELEVSRFKFTEKNATFGIYSNEVIKNYKNENTITLNELVDVIATDENGNVTNNVNLPQGQYVVRELKVSNPYALNKDSYEFNVEYTNNKDEAIQLTVNDGKIINKVKIVDFTFVKENEDGERVPGATYKVYEDEKCTKPVITIDDTEAEFTTDEDGEVKIPDMPTGIYFFKETVAPFGYKVSEEIVKVALDEDDEVVTMTAVEPYVEAELLGKYDSFTRDAIADCEFEITDEEENVVYTGCTDKDGILSVPVLKFELGKKYYYQETDVDPLYNMDEEKVEFIADFDEETAEWKLDTFAVKNDRKAIEKLIVRKIDSENGDPLEGCVFTIVLLDAKGNEYVNKNGQKIYLVVDAVTGENGECVIENVPYGTYKFVEITPPEGYELDKDITGYTFTINEKSPQTVIFEVTNTGDIAVYALGSILLVSAAGIAIIAKRKLAK